MRPSSGAAVTLLVGILAGGGGCGGGLLGDRDRLKTALDEYNEGLRWGKVDQCAAHLPLELRPSFAEKFAGLADELEVVEYDLQRIQWDRAGGSADVRAAVSWSLKRRGLVERTVVEQHWQEVRGGWFLVGQKRLQGSPMPLLEDIGPAAQPPAPVPAAPASPPPVQ